MSSHLGTDGTTVKICTLLAAMVLSLAVSACSGVSGGSGKNYDISPIFPLSAGKCAKYHGDEKGSGFTATCMVTKDECEKAAADWRQAMQHGYVTDAIQFRCD
ncbi:hypothetical protein I6A60_00110 [Frankia sp. AgB1.9]|uniref:hypothetical protein n=1 Tax=unclassified Frankia TaxID=2632575 RepID=UPI001932E8BC|nr:MULTISPECIES: hypothetical protein [unclassified Frankia]MBL7487283.1 hypothetical protein [Frankia sp. AgW1.1]MBL7546290.1 hypothetical protein [Frankia sp. AgB1.9]MBL7618665.1 hypothetical protein [Frankia sp. AgB1.8]